MARKFRAKLIPHLRTERLFYPAFPASQSMSRKRITAVLELLEHRHATAATMVRPQYAESDRPY